MIRLQDKPNVIAPDSDYPYGRIRNKSGVIHGTPVSQQVYGDMHQFFSRLMAIAGIVANGLPDNAYSGFQLITALQAVITGIVNTAVAAEAVLRTAADAVLQGNINSEASSRAGADTTLQTNINAFVDNSLSWTGPGAFIGFAGGWGNGGNLSFKNTARGTVKFRGFCSSAGTETTGNVAFTVQPSQRPAVNQRFIVPAAGNDGPVYIDILTDGTFRPGLIGIANGSPWPGTSGFHLDGIEYEI